MKNPIELSELVIKATAEATTEYRLAQAEETQAREGAKVIKFNGKESIFKRGLALDRSRSFAPELGEWGPEGQASLVDMVPQSLKDRVNRDLSFTGVAGTIALTDTAAGVRETITYDENEQIVLGFLNGEDNDQEPD